MNTILKIDREAALKWRNDEVISPWTKLYKPSPIVDCYLNGMKLSKAELDAVAKDIVKWRHRLNCHRITRISTSVWSKLPNFVFWIPVLRHSYSASKTTNN
jgi:hypothetical protein